MMKPRTGNIDCFCSKLTQSNMKGLLKILCEHKCHTKYGSGLRSGHKRSRKVTKFKNTFLDMRHMFSGHFCTYNSKIEAILQSDPKKSTKEKGQVNPRVTKGQIFKSIFLNQKHVFLNQFDLRIPKMSFVLLSDV